MIYEPPLSEASRYRDSVVKVDTAGRKLERRERTNRGLLRPLSHAQSTSYRIVEGDRIDILAASVFGDPRLWWILADLNPSTIPDALRLVPGTEIRIPDDDQVDALLAEFG